MSQLSTRRGWKAAAVGGALVLALAACGGGSSGGDGGGGEESSEPIRIGTSLPLTGEFSQPGQAAKEGYEVWQEMINDEGGLLGRQVELVVKDDASNQNTIVADYRQADAADDEERVQDGEEVDRGATRDGEATEAPRLGFGVSVPRWL
jgi:branched-chain amino acid transport system substrate-binding protein